jgi:flagellar protein FliL
MTDQAVTEAVETPAEETGSRLKIDRKKLIIFGGAGGLLLLLAAGGGLYFTGMLDRFVGKKPASAEAAPPKPLVFFDLPDFLVNLNATGKKASFLKLTVSLQIEKPEDAPRIQAVLPRIIDNCQIFLRELRVEDLRGSGGIYRLREELLSRVNAASPVKVEDVLFKEMLVQ